MILPNIGDNLALLNNGSNGDSVPAPVPGSELVQLTLQRLNLDSSSGEDPRLWWQTAWYLPRSTRTSPPPRSGQRPRGNGVLPIFIRQGWPQAMSHLSAKCW
jgi:hypothetical protein